MSRSHDTRAPWVWGNGTKFQSSYQTSCPCPVHLQLQFLNFSIPWMKRGLGEARWGRFSPIVKHGTAQQQPAECGCALCVLTWITVTVLPGCHQPVLAQMRSVTSDRRFAPPAASWWEPSLNYLLPEAINVIYPSCILLIRIVSFDTNVFYQPGQNIELYTVKGVCGNEEVSERWDEIIMFQKGFYEAHHEEIKY